MNSTRWITVPAAHPIPPGVGKEPDGKILATLSFWDFLSGQVLTRPFWRRSGETVAAAQRIWRLFVDAAEDQSRELSLADWQWLAQEAQLTDIAVSPAVLPALWHHQAAIFGASDEAPEGA